MSNCAIEELYVVKRTWLGRFGHGQVVTRADLGPDAERLLEMGAIEPHNASAIEAVADRVRNELSLRIEELEARSRGYQAELADCRQELAAMAAACDELRAQNAALTDQAGQRAKKGG